MHSLNSRSLSIFSYWVGSMQLSIYSRLCKSILWRKVDGWYLFFCLWKSNIPYRNQIKTRTWLFTSHIHSSTSSLASARICSSISSTNRSQPLVEDGTSTELFPPETSLCWIRRSGTRSSITWTMSKAFSWCSCTGCHAFIGEGPIIDTTNRPFSLSFTITVRIEDRFCVLKQIFLVVSS